VEYGRLLRVEVLGLGVTDDPSTERDHATVQVADREHHALEEPVPQRDAPPLAFARSVREVRFDDLLGGEALPRRWRTRTRTAGAYPRVNRRATSIPKPRSRDTRALVRRPLSGREWVVRW
jgi:hypothetical protein